MIEIIQVLLQFFVFSTIFFFPINLSNGKHVFKKYNYSIFDIFSANAILHFTFYLFISFYEFNLKIVFLFLLFASFFYLIKDIKLVVTHFKKNKTILLFFIFLCFLIFIDLTSNLRMEWDGQAGWIYRTLNFFEGYSFENLKNIPGVVSYPHLGTFAWAFYYKNTFLQYEYLGRLIFAFIFLLSIFSVSDLLKSSINLKIIFIFLITILSYDRYLFGGYQEYLLFSFLLIFSKFFIIFLKIIDKGKLLFSLLLLCGNILIWTKNEGFFLFIFLMILFCSYKKINLNYRFLFAFFAITFLIFKVYMFQIFFGDSSFQSSYQHNEYFNYLFDISRYIERFVPIFMHILIAMFKYPLWIIVLFSMFLIFKDVMLFKNYNYFLIFFLLNIAFIFGSYFFTSHANWNHHLGTTVDRLIFQDLGFYIPLIVLTLNRKFFR